MSPYTRHDVARPEQAVGASALAERPAARAAAGTGTGTGTDAAPSGRLAALRDRRFLRHYAEMVAAMFLGMLVLGIPAEAGLQAIGSSSGELQDDAPALALLGMCFIMTVPMIGWMLHRGHGWRPNTEMALSMLLPTLGVIALMWTGAVEDFMTLMGLEHVVMLPAMLAAMLLRPAEYTACHVHRRTPTALAA